MTMFIYQNPKDFFYVAHKCEETPNIGHFFGHTHDHYEVFLFLKGDASFNVEGNIFKLSPNDIILIPPHQYHCLILDRLAVYERYVIEIPLDRVPASLKEIFEKTEICNVTENTPLLDLFHRLDTYHNLLDGEDFGKICRHMVQELLLVLRISLGRGDSRHSYDPLTKRILTYINDNLTKPLTIDELSETFYLSRSHIQNVFSQNMKIGIKSYISQKKMLRAKELLQSGKKPYEVAELLGYSDYATFFKNFKKHYRIPPKEFYVKR